jgi:hypothetical protein
MTPPSTSQIAPVTQLACGESRNVTVEAMSRAVPPRPRGWKASKPASVWSIWSLGMNGRGIKNPAAFTSRVASARCGELLPDVLDLAAVGEVGGDAPGRALLAQPGDRLNGAGQVTADDHGAASAGNHVGRRALPHVAAAAHHNQLPSRVRVQAGQPRLCGTRSGTAGLVCDPRRQTCLSGEDGPRANRAACWWREVGGTAVSVGSDAHLPRRVGDRFKLAVGIVEAAGFTAGRDPRDFWRV